MPTPSAIRHARLASCLVVGLIVATACVRSGSPAVVPNVGPAAVTTDTVRPGDPRLDARRVRLARDTADWWTEGRGERRIIGRFDDRVERGTLGGRPALVRVLAVTSGTATIVDSSWSDPRTLAPFAHRSRQPARSLGVTWRGDTVEGGVQPASGPRVSRDSVLGLRTFDSSNWDLIVRSLDLAPGITRVFPVYDVDARVSWYRATVARDTVVAGRRALVVDAQLGRSWASLTLDAATRVVLEQRMGNPQAPMRVVAASPEGAARRVLERAVQAAGGDRALTAARTLWWQGTATVTAGPRPIEIEGTWHVLPPDSAIVETRPVGSGAEGTRALLLASPNGWVERQGARTPMPAALLASERDEFWFYHLMRLVPLRDTRLALAPAVADSAGWSAITIAAPGRPTVTLQFDEAYRLRQLAARIAGADGRAVQQVLALDGTREAGGVRWFRTMTIRQDGTPYFRLTVEDIAVDRPLDRSRLAP